MAFTRIPTDMIQDRATGQKLSDKLNNMAKVPNEYQWTATNGQTDFVIPNGTIADEKLVISFTIDRVPQDIGASENVQLVNGNTFRVSEGLATGSIVKAKWFEAAIPSTVGHKSTHELGGQDEIDLTKLKNYQEYVAAPLADNAKQLTDRIISAKDKQFGAKGDGVTDDTAALQSFFNYVVNNSLEGKIPAGTYLINNEITIPSSPGWKIVGANANSTIIKQATDNKPILHFLSTPSYSHSIQIRDIAFDYVNLQTSSNTLAFPIYFETMVYESTFDNLSFNGGYYGMFVKDAVGNPWGCTFDNLRFGGNLSGGAMRMSTSNAVPNNKIGRVFVSAQNMIGPIFNLKGYNFVIDTIEVISADKGAQLLFLQAGATVEIGAIKLENGIYTSSQALINASPNTKIHIGSISIDGDQNMTINPSSGTVSVITSTGGTPYCRATIGHVTLGGTSIANAYLFGSIDNVIIHSIDFKVATWGLTNIGSTTACETLLVNQYLNNHLTGDKGDVDYTVSLGDPNTFQYNTILTAPRVITLPTDSLKLFNGLRYRVIIGSGVVTATNTLTIKASTTTLKTLTTGNLILEYTFMRKNGGNMTQNWILTGYSTIA